MPSSSYSFGRSAVLLRHNLPGSILFLIFSLTNPSSYHLCVITHFGEDIMLNIGDKAPDFTLTSDEGKQISLSDYKGNRVILYFYPKASTPSCTIEACEFRDLKSEFDKEDVVVLGVSADFEKALKNFKTKQRLNFPLLGDPTHKMIKSYGAWRMKKFMGRSFKWNCPKHVLDWSHRQD